MKSECKKIDTLLNEAEAIVWSLIEEEAIRVLKDTKNAAHSFVTAMGGWTFYDKNGDSIEQRKWMERMDSIYDMYNSIFKMYGAGIRWVIQADGSVLKKTD